MKSILKIVLALLILSCHAGFSQRPTISSIDKIKASFGEIIQLKGTGFGTDATKLKVLFGPVAGTIKSVTNQLIEVAVPTGTTFDNISVTNTSNGLTGYSSNQFLLSFGGNQGLASSNFATEFQRAVDVGLYDIALGDFDGDNLPDVVCTSDQFNSLAILYNGSSTSALNFTKNNSALSNIKTFHVATGDLTGDGRLDIVASEGNDGNRIIIYRNVGSRNWNITAIPLAGRKVKRVAIADLDLDGKPEIVVTDKGSNTISILPNQSTLSNASFGAVRTLTIPGAISTDALEIKDMNGDGSPEIITSQFNIDNSNLFIFANKSSPGNFNLTDITTLAVSNSIVNVRVGDLDGDEKPDIIATRLLGSDVAIFKNESTASKFSFGAIQLIRTNIRPWGLDLGDLDGDGKIDIAISSIDNTIGKTISILNNKSDLGSIKFADLLTLNTQFINRHVRIGDMDGDAKPDIVFASVDDNQTGVPASKVSIFRNTSCLVPKINPDGPLKICSGYPLSLKASNSPGTQYEWKNGSTILPVTAAELAVTTSGNYSVKATSENGVCQQTSSTTSITVSAASATLSDTPTPTSTSPVCTGSDLKLSINDVGGTEYRWTGPAGYSFSTSSLTATVGSFSNEKAGIYSVDIIKGGSLASGGCIAKTITVTAENIDIPAFIITNSGGDVLCEGTSKILGLSPVLTSGFGYQWFNAAGEIPGEKSSTLNVTATGEYYATITSLVANCGPQTTSVSKITVLTLPIPAFSISPATLCSGINLVFNNQSTTDPKSTPTYSWLFGDGITSELPSPTHSYSSAATFSVVLTVDYQGVTGCSSKTTKSTTINTAVKPVFSPSSLSVCKDETKTLSLSGSFTSITWNTNATTPSISISQAGTYSVTTIDQNGCSSSSQLIVGTKPAPTITVTSDKLSVSLGKEVQLTASGADNYSWLPAETLDNPKIANPKAKPTANTTYTVTGVVTDGCSGKNSIDISIDTEPPPLKVTNVFTPNGDGKNDVWIIPGIEFYQDCTLTLFDKNGSKVFEQKGYKNDWDGNYNGKAAPEGTYYYLLSCSDKKPETGNLLLAR
jgi:gliding motility-associated-like protein